MKNRYEKIKLFFLFSSGASKEYLDKCPNSEQIKYACIGVTVFFTGLFASLAGGYALFTVFKTIIPALLFGLLWGSFIFNIDRYIVSSMRKSGGFKKELIQAIPRILLATVIAVTISRPLELRLFSDEITKHLTDEVEQEKLNITELYKNKINEEKESFQSLMKKKQGELWKYQNHLSDYKKKRDEAFKDYKCECDGTCGTGIRGEGPECERKEAFYVEVNAEYRSEYSRLSPIVQGIQRDISELQDKFSKGSLIENEAIEKFRAEKERRIDNVERSFSTSFLSQNEALWELSSSNSGILTVSIVLTFLFFVVETAPVFVKLFAPEGPYDYLLDLEIIEGEHAKSLREFESRKEMHSEQVSDYDRQIRELSKQKQVDVEKAFYEAKTPVEIDKINKLVDDWKNGMFSIDKYTEYMEEGFYNYLRNLAVKNRSDHFKEIGIKKSETEVHKTEMYNVEKSLPEYSKLTTPEEMKYDWQNSEVDLAIKILKREIKFEQLSDQTYKYLEAVWLKDVKQIMAYLNWVKRGKESDPELEKKDYYDACNDIYNMLVDPKIKVSKKNFGVAREYMEDCYLINGTLAAKRESTMEVIRKKAERISENTGETNLERNWYDAETYVKMFYENIIPAVVNNDLKRALKVLEAFQYNKAPMNRFLIVNIFEAAVAIYFLDPEIIKTLWKQPELSNNNMIPVIN